MKRRIKKEDIVVVIAGSQRSSGGNVTSGRVIAVDHDKGRVLVEGVNVRQVSRKRTGQGTGGFDHRECPIHISNVMLKERYDERRGAAPAAGEKES